MTEWRVLLSIYSRTCCSVVCLDYEDRSDEQLDAAEFLNCLSPSGLHPHAVNVTINTTFTSLIMQQLRTLQSGKFPSKVAFAIKIRKAQGQALNPVAIYIYISIR